MKRFIKYLFSFFVLLFFALVIFFFWGSSATLDKNEYAKLVKTEVRDKFKNDSVFSILSYNIGYLSGMTNNLPLVKSKSLFDSNLEKVKLELNKLNVAIIAFQEIDYNASRSYHIHQEQEIAQLGYSNIATAVNWDKRYIPFPYWPFHLHFGKVVSGQSILSKYPIKEHQRIALQRDATAPFYRDAFYLERLAQVVKIDLKGKEVVVINVHLEAFDKQTRVKQFKEVLGIFNKYKREYPTILLGDFNSRARDANAIIKEMFEMKNVGNVAFDAAKIENTFSSKNPFERIDYIFYTRNTIEYLSGKVVTAFGQASDHLPVYMNFKLK